MSELLVGEKTCSLTCRGKRTLLICPAQTKYPELTWSYNLRRVYSLDLEQILQPLESWDYSQKSLHVESLSFYLRTRIPGLHMHTSSLTCRAHIGL